MRYISADIETSGKNSEFCQVLEFAAVLEDTNTNTPLERLPHFHYNISHEKIIGEPYALQMHQALLLKIANKINCIYETKLALEFRRWLVSHGFKEEKDQVLINAAGKNFSNFDLRFLEKIPDWNKHIRIRSRVLDPSILYWNPDYDDTLPSLQECLDRANIKKDVPHNALEDSLLVIELIRKKYERNL